MAWIRLDDSFADHPKVVKAGPFAITLQIRALCYASRNLTDGSIMLEIVPRLTTDFPPPPSIFDDWPSMMVAFGLWEQIDHGYLIHDYLKYNPSRDAITEKKQRLRSAGQAGGLAKAKHLYSKDTSKQPGKTLASGLAKPKQNPSITSSISPSTSPLTSPFSALQEKEKGDSKEEKEKEVPHPFQHNATHSSPPVAPSLTSQARSVAPSAPLSDEDRLALNPFASTSWLDSLPSLHEYRSINVRLELVRAKLFLQNHPQQSHTKEFYTQWLDDALNHHPHKEVAFNAEPLDSPKETELDPL